ncbi:MAG TPA: hypothetical protein VFC85_04400 [Verrucomicrobiae bacterium]|nr:hypothetical protein [Verrucomicrobiae bacterium]
MSEFKYACPVCGQHIKCDSSQAGTQMECPTCFQKITVPQAPASNDQKLIITGIKVGERPAPKIPEVGSSLPAAKKFPGTLVVVVILIFVGAVVAYIYHGAKFSLPFLGPTYGRDNQSNSTTEIEKSPPTQQRAVANLPPPGGTNFWTLNVEAMATPAAPVGGKVHGKFFTAQKVILNGDGLTIRTAKNPPEAGVTIYLRPNPLASVFGKTVVVKAGAANVPLLNLRWKDAQGRAVQQPQAGYALRIEFGQPASNSIPGKIYLCTSDEMKSYVVGSFNAEITRPKAP